MYFDIRLRIFALIFFLSTASAAQAASTQANAVPIQAYSKVSFYKINTNYPGLFNPQATFMWVNTIRGGLVSTPLNAFYANQLRAKTFPFAMVVSRERGVDIATGAAPAFSKLVTLVSEQMAADPHPIFATPLTTLAYEMAYLATPPGSSRELVFAKFQKMGEIVRANFGYGMSNTINITRHPAAHNEAVVTANDRLVVAEHRAAIEAFTSALLRIANGSSQSQLTSYYTSALSRIGKAATLAGVTVPDLLIKMLAYDYVVDGTFDGKAKGSVIPGLALDPFRAPLGSMGIYSAHSLTVADVAEFLKLEAAQQGYVASYPPLPNVANRQTFAPTNVSGSSTYIASGDVLSKTLAPSSASATPTGGIAVAKPTSASSLNVSPKQFNPGHYVTLNSRFNVENQIVQSDLRNSRLFKGAQIRYWWRDLEPAEGQYNFSALDAHLALLGAMGKKAVIQIDTILWGTTSFGFPNYLASPKYAGGYFRRKSGSAVPKKYNPMVAQRMRMLVRKLGERYSNNLTLEAIVLGETALGVDDAQVPAQVTDYSPSLWRNEIMNTITEARRAFPTTVVIHYLNYLDRADKLLADVVNHARSLGVGIGGPDLRPNFEAAWRFHYKYYEQVAGSVPLGTAVQWDNYTYQNPATGRQVTIREILDYGLNSLHLNYFFWEIRPPFFPANVTSVLAATNAPINR